MKLNRFWTMCFGVVFGVGSSFAITPTIGVASSTGSFKVNSALVDGNANLFDSSHVQTVDASSNVFLQTGATFTLGINSAGAIYKDHLLLEQGVAKLTNMNAFSVEAGAYRIESGQPLTQAVVRLNGSTLEVAALTGSVNVLNEKGALLTRIGAGTASAFQAAPGGQSGASAGNNNRKKKEVIEYTALGGMLAGLGIAVDAILQPTSP
ncbi:MAG: hypothetical protein WB992_09375 [Bryobacteraceae bacterium]